MSFIILQSSLHVERKIGNFSFLIRVTSFFSSLLSFKSKLLSCLDLPQAFKISRRYILLHIGWRRVSLMLVNPLCYEIMRELFVVYLRMVRQGGVFLEFVLRVFSGRRR